MRFGNFLFPECRDPQQESRVLDETLREAKLSDRLGVDVLWLAEHHFDGNCVYVDPVSFAAALATCTTRIMLGFAVAQMSLHHPIRLAEQLGLIDHLSKGRLIVGLGRGTGHNIYTTTRASASTTSRPRRASRKPRPSCSRPGRARRSSITGGSGISRCPHCARAPIPCRIRR